MSAFGKKIDLSDRYAFDSASEPKIVDATAKFVSDDGQVLSGAGGGDLSAFGAPLTRQEFEDITGDLNLEPELLWSVVVKESLGGRGFYGSKQPIILFELHKFSQHTKGKYDRSHPGVSDPDRGTYGLYSEQFDRLEEAESLNREAAYKSVSWGLGQVMGFNYEYAGYDNVIDMVADMERSEANQLRAMVSFIKENRLDGPLRHHQWADFARGYNGSGYKRNNYDELLAQHYRHLKDGHMPDFKVRAVQLYLQYLNFKPGAIDGDWGPNTRSQFQKFQKAIKHKVTDDIDDETYATLKIASSHVERGVGIQPGKLAGTSLAAIAGSIGSKVAGKQSGDNSTAVVATAAIVGVGADEAAVFAIDVAEKETQILPDGVTDEGDVISPPTEPVDTASPAPTPEEATPTDDIESAPDTVEPEASTPVEAPSVDEPSPADAQPDDTSSSRPEFPADEPPVEPSPPEELPTEELPAEAPSPEIEDVIEEPSTSETEVETSEPAPLEVDEAVVDEMPVPDSPPPLDDTVVVEEMPDVIGDPAPEPEPSIEPEPDPVAEPVVEASPEPVVEAPEVESEGEVEETTSVPQEVEEPAAPAPEQSPVSEIPESVSETANEGPIEDAPVDVATELEPFDLDETIAVASDWYQVASEWYAVGGEFYDKANGVVQWLLLDGNWHGGEVREMVRGMLETNQFYLRDLVLMIAQYPWAYYLYRAAIFLSMAYVVVRTVRRLREKYSPAVYLRRLFQGRNAEMARVLRKYVLR